MLALKFCCKNHCKILIPVEKTQQQPQTSDVVDIEPAYDELIELQERGLITPFKAAKLRAHLKFLTGDYLTYSRLAKERQGGDPHHISFFSSFLLLVHNLPH